MRRLLAPVLTLVLLCLVSVRHLNSAPDSEPPMDNETVVLMIVEGRSEREIIRIIEASRVQFDLEADVMQELRKVGVSTRLLDVMRRRQIEAGVSSPPLSPVPSEEMGNFEIRFASMEPEDGNRPSFFVVRKIPKALTDRMTLEAPTEFDELALFVVCTDPLHVPDHWMDRTNIKKFRRHAVLGFRPGSQQKKKKGFQVLQLDLSDPLDGQAPVGTHRLSVGVAVRAGSEWLVVQSDDWNEAAIHSDGTTQVKIRLFSELSGSMMTGYQAKQDLSIADVIEPEESLIAIGSGGPYALAAARSLLHHTEMSAREIVESALTVAADICVFTNHQRTIEELEASA